VCTRRLRPAVSTSSAPSESSRTTRSATRLACTPAPPRKRRRGHTTLSHSQRNDTLGHRHRGDRGCRRPPEATTLPWPLLTESGRPPRHRHARGGRKLLPIERRRTGLLLAGRSSSSPTSSLRGCGDSDSEPGGLVLGSRTSVRIGRDKRPPVLDGRLPGGMWAHAASQHLPLVGQRGERLPDRPKIPVRLREGPELRVRTRELSADRLAGHGIRLMDLYSAAKCRQHFRMRVAAPVRDDPDGRGSTSAHEP
jgi:hypothetical protein